MRSKLANALRKHFGYRMKQQLPQFREVKGANIPPGCRLFEWKPTPSLACYVFLVIAPYQDWFTVEIAWSRRGVFPANAAPSLPYEDLQGEQARFRLHYLWADPGRDFWWEVQPELSPEEQIEQLATGEPVSEEALARIPFLVDNAMKHITEYARPYFETVATQGAPSDC